MSLDLDKKVYDLLNEQVNLQPFMISIGFDKFENVDGIKAMTKIMTLRKILKLRGIAVDDFLERFEQFNGAHDARPQVAFEDADVVVKGALPCPVKDKIIELYDATFAAGELKVYSDFKSASLGYDFIADDEQAVTVADLPDIFISPGFAFPFLDARAMPLFNGRNFLTDCFNYNAQFAKFKDPRGVFQMAGAVPCVFLVNKTGHVDGACPRSWAELVDPNVAVEVTLPISDLDMLNAVVLTVHSHFGDAGVKNLLAKCTNSLHPSQMVKTMLLNKAKPSINVIPYFFSVMAERNPNVEIIWPEDGAILNPIFMAFKSGKDSSVTPLVEFFGGVPFAESMHADGKFPGAVAGVDNHLPGDFLWAGWDYLYDNDLAAIMKQYEEMIK